MQQEVLWSLRLGFSSKNADSISNFGIEKFLQTSFNDKSHLITAEPEFLQGTPKTRQELAEYRQIVKGDKEKLQATVKEHAKKGFEMKAWWLERMNTAAYPFREKMNLFWHNHFVSTLQAVKIPYWIYQHYSIINTHSLGNIKTLTREMMYSNAMIRYLDNNQNRRNNINENLARELLELFTMGEGHYTENDIKNTARALAGLTIGEEKGVYRKPLMDPSTKTVFGRSGDFIIDDVIEIIFEQKNTPLFFTEKILKWFIYDNPPKELVTAYGKKLLEYEYELIPFLTYVFTQEFGKNTSGSKIKDAITFSLQMTHELNLTPNYKFLAFFIKNQGMDLFDQPNVKGWEGGNSWLTSQIYLNRTQFVDFLTLQNNQFTKQLQRQFEKYDGLDTQNRPIIQVKSDWGANDIIGYLSNRMVFRVDEELKDDMASILKYDFDPKSENASHHILNLFNFLAKSPEFQLI